jgi:hypothetical protein
MSTEDDKISARDVAATFVKGGIVAAVGYGLYRLLEWFRRDEDGPAGSGFGVGFGKGNAGINVNPLDKGEAGTGDGDGELDGEKWERAEVSGVKGWRRRGIPLPKEEGGPETYQAAVLIMGDGDAIPDMAGWPNNLPAFFVHDDTAPYPNVDGGWMVDATFGSRAEPPGRTVTCQAATSADLFNCVKAALDDLLPGQWQS